MFKIIILKFSALLKKNHSLNKAWSKREITINLLKETETTYIICRKFVTQNLSCKLLRLQKYNVVENIVFQLR